MPTNRGSDKMNYQQTVEEKIILHCCSLAIKNKPYAIFSSDQLNDIDYDRLYKECDEHRLLLLVYHFFIAKNKCYIPQPVIEKFYTNVKNIICSQLLLTNELLKICDFFEKDNIEYIVLKGPPLNQQIFAHQLLRYSGDIDLLVHPNNILSAHHSLRRLGYNSNLSEKKIAFFSKRKFFPGPKDAIYISKNSPFRVELHWKTEQIELIMPSNGYEWCDLIKIISFRNREIPVLTDEFNILYLCLHGAKHYWSRARWLLDIPLFLKNNKLNVEYLSRIASKKKLSHILIESLLLANKTFDLAENYMNYNLCQSFYFRQRIWIITHFRHLSKVQKTLLNVYNQLFLYPITNKFPLFIYTIIITFKNTLLFFLKKRNRSSRS